MWERTTTKQRPIQALSVTLHLPSKHQQQTGDCRPIAGPGCLRDELLAVALRRGDVAWKKHGVAAAAWSGDQGSLQAEDEGKSVKAGLRPS